MLDPFPVIEHGIRKASLTFGPFNNRQWSTGSIIDFFDKRLFRTTNTILFAFDPNAGSRNIDYCVRLLRVIITIIACILRVQSLYTNILS